MRIRNDESGQALVLTALCMTILLGFTGLAVDVGMLFHAKRNMQIAADAAATAAAVDFLYNPNPSMTSAIAAGQKAAQDNGVINGSGGAVVTINMPPSVGPNAGASGFIEAIVTTPNPTIFMNAFSALFSKGASSFRSVTVAARAVASVTGGSTCLYLTDTSGTALQLGGTSAALNAPGCGVYVNSPDTQALVTNGTGSNVNVSYLDVVGSSTSTHMPAGTLLNAATRANPLDSLPNPSTCDTTDSSTGTVSSSTTISALGVNKVYCFVNTVTLPNGSAAALTLNGPGVFVFQNGVSIGSGTTLTTNNATIDISGGSFNQASNSTLQLSADANVNDTYNGIALMVPSSNTTYQPNPQNPNKNDLTLFGSGQSTLNGIIYAPSAELNLQDQGATSTISCGHDTSSNICTTVIVSSLRLSGTLNIANYNSGNPTTSPLRVVALVE